MGSGILKAIIVLVPTYITAYLTDKMVYVIPMLAAASFVAASIDGDKVGDLNFEVSKSDNPQILKAGKRKFLKII